MPLFTPPLPAITYRPTFWYHARGANAGTVQFTQGQPLFSPLVVRTPHVFTAIGLEVTTAASTNSVTRLGIYTDSSGSPGALVLDAGTIPSSCVAGTSKITISQPLFGVYWVCAVGQGSPVTQPVVRALTLDNPEIGLSTVLSQFAPGYVQTASVAGALPAAATPGNESGSVAAVMLQA